MDEPFNPMHLEVDRIIDEGEVDIPEGEHSQEPIDQTQFPYYPKVTIPINETDKEVYFLIKWCSLPYEYATWEKKSLIELAFPDAFKRYLANNHYPGDNIPARVPKPAWNQCIKLEKSPKYNP
jgi:chromodomain helicase DNA binding protein 8